MLANQCRHLLTREQPPEGWQLPRPQATQWWSWNFRTWIFSCPGTTSICFSQKARVQSSSSLKPQWKDEKEIRPNANTTWQRGDIWSEFYFPALTKISIKGIYCFYSRKKVYSKKWKTNTEGKAHSTYPRRHHLCGSQLLNTWAELMKCCGISLCQGRH